MSETINKKIRGKIKDSDMEEPIKDFLLAILHLEYEHNEEKGWKFKKEYDRLIKKYTKELGD